MIPKTISDQWTCKIMAGLRPIELGLFDKYGRRKEVGVYNNVKSYSYSFIKTADGYMKFGDYLHMV
ncbi:MAG: hypothetical protein WEA59_02345 [Ferruginibacter sp.]